MRRFLIRTLILALASGAIGAAAFFMRADRLRARAAPARLAQEGYDALKGELVGLLKSEGSGAALAELRRRVAADPLVARECHPIAHALGYEAYVKAGSFAEALRGKDEICNSGFLHGVIESHFALVDDADAAMRSVCSTYPAGTYLGWECYHGIGHGLMFRTENDLPASLRACESYGDAAARGACVNGVYMENFNADRELHPSEFLDPTDPFSPCDERGTVHKADCYLYAPTYYLALHPGGYEDALRWCRSAEEGYRGFCARGVGAETAKEHTDDPRFVERVCRSGTAVEAADCLYGMADHAVLHYGALAPAYAVCAALSRESRPVCDAAVDRSAGRFAGGD